MTDGADRLPQHDRPTGLLVAAAALALFLCTAGGSMATTDAVISHDVTRQLIDDRSVALSDRAPAYEAYRGIDGRHYAPFGLAQALWNVPFFLAGRAVAAWLPNGAVGDDALTKASVTIGSAFAATLCVWLVWNLASRLGAAAIPGVMAAVFAAVCTSLWPYSKFGYNVCLVSAFLTGTVLYSWTGGRSGRAGALVAGGAIWSLALLTRHEMALLAIPAFALAVTGRVLRRRVAAAWWILGGVPGVVTWAWYNVARFGSPFATGYERDAAPGMGSSILEGLWGLLASPGVSIALYSPIVVPAVASVIAMRRRDPRLAWATLGLLVGFLAFYAQLGNFAGGRSYGPRYLVPFVPVLCAWLAVWMPTLSSRVRRTVVGICVVSALIQIPGVLVDFSKQRMEFARTNPGHSYDTLMHQWPSSPLALNVKAAVRIGPRVVRHLCGLATRPAAVRPSGAHGGFSDQFGESLDLWWVYLFYLGVIPGWAAVTMGLSLMASSAVLLRLAWRRAIRAGPHAGGR